MRTSSHFSASFDLTLSSQGHFQLNAQLSALVQTARGLDAMTLHASLSGLLAGSEACPLPCGHTPSGCALSEQVLGSYVCDADLAVAKALRGTSDDDRDGRDACEGPDGPDCGDGPEGGPDGCGDGPGGGEGCGDGPGGGEGCGGEGGEGGGGEGGGGEGGGCGDGGDGGCGGGSDGGDGCGGPD